MDSLRCCRGFFSLFDDYERRFKQQVEQDREKNLENHRNGKGIISKFDERNRNISVVCEDPNVCSRFMQATLELEEIKITGGSHVCIRDNKVSPSANNVVMWYIPTPNDSIIRPRCCMDIIINGGVHVGRYESSHCVFFEGLNTGEANAWDVVLSFEKYTEVVKTKTESSCNEYELYKRIFL